MSAAYEFGPFCLDPAAERLTRDGREVELQPKPFLLLSRVLSAAGDLVTREELSRLLHPDTHVSEHALRNLVLKVREALGPEHAGWVETVPRRGLRFVGPVSRRGVDLSPPPSRDGFVGRKEQLEELARALEGSRLVTVTGPGGMGKTRLVQELLRGRESVVFCPLESAHTAAEVCTAVATRLGVPLEADELADLVGRALAARGPTLLVLDNVEQVASVAAAAVGAWLAGASSLHVLLTSRICLRLPGERLLEVPPLSVAEASELFCARALAIEPSLGPTELEPSAVGALVEVLDGLPLAVELAAARLRVMSVETLRARIHQRFLLLARSFPAGRQGTLRATLDVSWELSAEADRLGLAQLSVFRGGIPLAAAEGVLRVGAAFVPDVMDRLVHQSLLRRVGPERFALLETVREYAAERLDELGARGECEARHCACFAEWVRDRSEDELWSEADNVWAAARSAVERGHGPEAAATLAAWWSVHTTRGPFRPALALAERALALPLAGRERLSVLAVLAALRQRLALAPAEVVAEGLALAEQLADAEHLGRFSLQEAVVWLHRDQAVARRAADRALGIARERGDRRAEVRALLVRSHPQLARGEGARADVDRALVLAREIGEPRLEAQALGDSAAVRRAGGEPSAALVHFQAAMEAAQRLGDRGLTSTMEIGLGACREELGDHASAEAHYQRALELETSLGRRVQQAIVWANLGTNHYFRKDFAQARRCYRHALTLHRETGARQLEAIAWYNLGSLEFAERAWAEAAAAFRAAAEAAREVGDLGHLRASWLAVAEVGRQSGGVAEVAEALARADAATADEPKTAW